MGRSKLGDSRIDSDCWLDRHGVRRRVPAATGKLNFKYPLHAALRAHVFYRDNFICQSCGLVAAGESDYDGRDTVFSLTRDAGGWPIYMVVDHILTLRAGGNHHPSNLQALCDPCNKIKGGTIDRVNRISFMERQQ